MSGVVNVSQCLLICPRHQGPVDAWAYRVNSKNSAGQQKQGRVISNNIPWSLATGYQGSIMEPLQEGETNEYISESDHHGTSCRSKLLWCRGETSLPPAIEAYPTARQIRLKGEKEPRQ